MDNKKPKMYKVTVYQDGIQKQTSDPHTWEDAIRIYHEYLHEYDDLNPMVVIEEANEDKPYIRNNPYII